MNIIVVGSGRVGSSLAILLSNNGHNVSVIDRLERSFKLLGRNFNGRTVKGIAYDEVALKEAGIEDCDVLAAVTNNDNANFMAAEVARRIYGVKHVVARVSDTERLQAYSLLGIDYVSGTELISQELYAKIIAGHSNHIDVFGDFELMSFIMSSPDDKKIVCSDLTDPDSIRIVAISHEGESLLPQKDTRIHDGDHVLAIVRDDRIGDIKKYMRA